ncbi:MAG: HU family DNA-binding protein [Bryobacteraceae bacterium]|nr:HU family DNA-binding protein [Bryobacteraceae bacterium]
MNRLIRRLAKRQNVSHAKAADQIDTVVHDIIQKLKKGETVSVPGLGEFAPGNGPVFRFEGPDARPK